MDPGEWWRVYIYLHLPIGRGSFNHRVVGKLTWFFNWLDKDAFQNQPSSGGTNSPKPGLLSGIYIFHRIHDGLLILIINCVTPQSR